MKRVVLVLLLPIDAFGFSSRLVDAAGRPLAAAQISVVNQSGSARADADGRFTLNPDPQFPATLIVIGSRGEVHPPVHLEREASEVRVEAAFRESVTVSMGATPNIEGTPAAAPVVIGAEEIEQKKPQHVVDAIAVIPGVALRGEGPPAVPVVRGLASGRTMLMIDDARIVAERRAGPSATFLDPLTLGSIEVSRGPGSVAYGSDAFGGVVHLRPRDPIPGEPGFRYDGWTSFGAESAHSAAVEVSADAFGGAVLAAMHARTADDAHDANGDRIANSSYRDKGALLRFVRDMPRGRFRAGLMTSVASDVGAPSSDPVQTVYPDERATLLTMALDLSNSIAVRASAGSYSITTNRIRTTGVESVAVKARDASVRVSGERAGVRSRLLAGVDFVTRFDLHAPGSIDDAERFDTGAFASWDGRVSESLQLAGGARADHVVSRNRGGFFGDRTRNDVAFSGHVAATMRFSAAISATAQLASGYREPTLSDRYFRGISGRGFITGNPELEPERSTQFDAALRWSGARSRATLFAYDYRIRDLVERYRDGANFFFRNRGEADIRGVEIELSTRPRTNLELLAGAALARGEDADTGAALDDIAPPTLHASLRWAAARASAFVTASAFARDDRPGPVEVERSGYTSFEAGTGWRILPALEIRLVVRNATNVQRFGSPDAVAAFAPGRSVMIGVNR